jgi:hypothetical protein
VNGQRVDHTYGAFVMKSLKLGDDLTVEIGLREAQDNHLHGSDGH